MKRVTWLLALVAVLAALVALSPRLGAELHEAMMLVLFVFALVDAL